jgi:hypothetical protein
MTRDYGDHGDPPALLPVTLSWVLNKKCGAQPPSAVSFGFGVAKSKKPRASFGSLASGQSLAAKQLKDTYACVLLIIFSEEIYLSGRIDR